MARDNRKAIGAIYAEALFETALGRDQSETVNRELAFLGQMARDNREFAVFLGCPGIDSEEKNNCIGRIFKGKLSKLVMNFLKVLSYRDRLALLAEIQSEYAKLQDLHIGTVRGTVVTAIDLSEKERVRLAEQIGRILSMTVVLQTKTDSSIIGGMILRIGNRVMDGSVSRTLQKISEQLKVRVAERLSEAGEFIIE